MNFKHHIENILYNLKNEMPTTVSPLIPVVQNGKKIAQLRLITKSMLSDDKIIKLLTKWRSEHQDAFPSQFKVTHAGTKKWGQAQLLNLPDRTLFFLETLDGRPFAHMGLFRFNYKEKSCEIDNVVRGVDLLPGSMTAALQALIKWTLTVLEVKIIYLQVFSDNEKAINLYRRCGFVGVKKKPLKKIVESGIIRFVDITIPKEKADRYFLVMKLMPDRKIGILEKVAKMIRKDILLMANRAKSAHVGGALSCVELLVALYFNVMKVFPKNPESDKRDRFIFSKAHDAKALYATLCARGFFDKNILDGYELDGGLLPGHSTRHAVPGIEASAGALGHGLSMATGMAYVGKIDKKKHRVFAMLSDGECDEGSTWEAILFAGHHKLDNLVVIVDYNKLQGFGYTKDILDLEPFAQKWESFGWVAKEIDGHNFDEILQTLGKVPLQKNKPTVIIAHTIKGLGGVPLHVNQISSQYKPPTDEELKKALKELKN
jgi:transketolase